MIDGNWNRTVCFLIRPLVLLIVLYILFKEKLSDKISKLR